MNTSPSQVIHLADVLQQAAQACNQRRALILSGDKTWGIDCTNAIIKHLRQKNCLWLSNQPPEGVEALNHTTVLKRLGSETDLLIYDAHDGFDADSFGASSGLIRGGGLLLLLTPPFAQWPDKPDPEAERFFKGNDTSRFIQRFIAIAGQADGIVQLCQNRELPEIQAHKSKSDQTELAEPPCRTQDQANAVKTIVATARSDTPTPCALISDRGRGKSSALGIAAAQLLQQGHKRILVTGPRMNSVEPVFEHAARLLPDSTQQRGLIKYKETSLKYIAADELISSTPDAELLLVDEAAAIPTPMLASLLHHYSRIVFATTVHGYEGTGRGFSLRFSKLLDRHTPGWQQLRLQQPIRWAEHDPLEQFVFDVLLLNAETATESDIQNIDLDQCRIEKIEQAQLLHNEKLLSQMFGLLVLAHYRTRPNDLRQLLDSPGLQLYAMRHGDNIIGVTLLMAEGGIDQHLSQQIYQGKRRLQGQLLPQSLAFHAGMVNAPGLRYLRIMRIAIHPALQGKGLGTKLIRHIIKNSDASRYDCIGTSFGVTTELLRFWQQLGFESVRLGLTREHSSGTYSLLMLYPLSDSGQQLTQQTAAHMQGQLPMLFNDILKGIEPQLSKLLLKEQPSKSEELELLDWQDIISFAYSSRGYEFCINAIHKLIKATIRNQELLDKLTNQQQQLLHNRVIKQQSWAESVAQTRLSGRNEAIQLLRQTLQVVAEHYCPTQTREQVNTLIDL